MSGVHNLVAADNKGVSEPTNEMLKEEGTESPLSAEEKTE